jgi:TetR/AcrR family transcriptional regulator, regulator of cefoperazone and chloramphenicol sensitivity
VRSVPDDDRTAKAVIRDEALRLFAEFGVDAVTMRQVAAAAGVSPALVVHHFGSKEGLRRAVDARVAGVFDGMFEAADGVDWTDPSFGGSLAEALVSHLPPDSPIPAYLRRLLLAGDSADGAGRMLFRRWYDAGLAMLDRMVAAGVVAPSDDPSMRAAFLMVNDLAVLLLRDHLTAVLGVDPLSGEGMGRWLREALAVYRDGLFEGVEHVRDRD